jgi:hypothetical protein
MQAWISLLFLVPPGYSEVLSFLRIRASRTFRGRVNLPRVRYFPDFFPVSGEGTLPRQKVRALSRAIEELERIHPARKARESSAASPAAESALPITVEEQSPSQVENAAVSESSAPEDPNPSPRRR